MKGQVYTIKFKPSFIKLYKKADPHLKEEIEDTLEKLKKSENHQKLKLHKLSGKLQDFYSCSINYKQRILFEIVDTKDIVVLLFGDHDIYK